MTVEDQREIDRLFKEAQALATAGRIGSCVRKMSEIDDIKDKYHPEQVAA